MSFDHLSFIFNNLNDMYQVATYLKVSAVISFTVLQGMPIPCELLLMSHKVPFWNYEEH